MQAVDEQLAAQQEEILKLQAAAEAGDEAAKQQLMDVMLQR